MKVFKLRYPLLLGAVSCAMSVAGPAQAQEEDTADKVEQAIERIVVTARNKEELLNKIPVSVTALSGEQMARTGVTSVEDIINQTPGVTYDSTGSLATGGPVIRGLAQPGLVGDETNVAVFIDGVYASGRDAAFLPTSGLERVEVVRGPQSALYGRNAFAGAINYITKAPSDEFEAGVDFTLGSDEMSQAQLYMSGAITEKLRARVDLSTSDSGSTIENIDQTTGTKIDDRLLGQVENEMARLKLSYDINDSMFVKFSHTEMRLEEQPRATAHLPHNAGFPVINASRELGVLISGVHAFQNPATNMWQLTGDWVFTGAPEKYVGEVTNDLWKSNFKGIPAEAVGTERDVSRTSLTFDYIGDDISFTYLGGINKTDYTINIGQLNSYPGQVILPTFVADFLPPAFAFPDAPPGLTETVLDLPGVSLTIFDGVMGYDIGGQPNDEREEVSHEIRFQGDMDTISWAAGAFYSKLELEQWLWNAVVGTDSYSTLLLETAGTGYTGGDPMVLQGTYHETETKSAFASISWDITDEVNATFEGRWTTEDKYANNHTDNRAPGILFPTGEMEDSWSYFTPRVTLDWDYSEDTLMYLNVGKGAKSGGLNAGASGDEAVFDPEENWTYEAGIKTFLADGKIRLNLAAYFIDWDKQQVRDFATLGQDENSLPAVIVTNLGKTEVKGIEFDARWQITESLNWNLAVALNDAEVVQGGLGPEFGYLDYQTLGMNPTDYPVSSDLIVINPMFGAPEMQQIPVAPGVFVDVPVVLPVPPPGTMVSDGDVSGKDMPRQSDMTLNTSFDYIKDFGSFHGFAELMLSYRSEQYLDSLNLVELPSATDVKLTIGVETQKIRASLFIKNLTDDDTPSAGYRKFLWNGNPQAVAEPRNGRMVGLNFSYKFH